MSSSPLKSIFLDALECDSEAAREALIHKRCGEDRSLMASVKELLQAHRQSSEMTPTAEIHPRLNQQIREAAKYLDSSNPSDSAAGRGHDRSGEQIGKYRLMELLAEGGFGQVYVGQESGSVKRLVAVKLLKPGMDSREVIARFEAERQALAMMHHPNIAQVFDAGTTSTGQPFLVMELVRGTAITSFCRDNSYSIRQKLELMNDVCLAVQHAHQKGIIHRDIKPSNVMVAMDDTRPLVKVIDFGIAKAMGGRITDHTIYTRFTQIIGTPMYMSPEQAEMKAQDVDTLTDVYALGVLLYELLTDATPFDKNKMQSASFDEMRRIIREDRPLKPSARMTAGLSKDSTASRRTDSGLSREAHQKILQHQYETINQLRGDLDWIVLKAMDKDRSRRYETPAELARDLTRYLAGEPVLARAPTTLYKLTRFAQRNKLAVIATSLVVLSMIGGTGVSIWQALRATKAQAESDLLRKEAVDSVARLKEANILLDSARANVDQQRWEEAMIQYSQATELQPEHFLTWAGRGSLFRRMGFWDEASKDYAKAVHLGAPANHPAWWGVPQLFLYTGDDEAFASICAGLRDQVRTSQDPIQTMFAIRGLCLVELDRSEAEELQTKMDTINLDFPGRGRPRGGPPGPPGLFDLFGESDVRRRDGRDGKRGADDGRRGGTDGPGRDGSGRPGPPPFRNGRDGQSLGPPWMVREVFEYVKALTAFRAGKYQQSIQLLKHDSASLKHRDSELAMMELPLTAMVLHQLGKPEEAKAELAAAIELYRKSASSPSEKSARALWFDLFDAWILLREAHQLIFGTTIELEGPSQGSGQDSKGKPLPE